MNAFLCILFIIQNYYAKLLDLQNLISQNVLRSFMVNDNKGKIKIRMVSSFMHVNTTKVFLCMYFPCILDTFFITILVVFFCILLFCCQQFYCSELDRFVSSLKRLMNLKLNIYHTLFCLILFQTLILPCILNHF